MSAAQTRPAEVAPVAGPKFREAAARPIEGQKRRKVYCLIAAFADAGLESVTVGQLAPRLGLPWVKVDALARRLEQDGLLVGRTKRKRRRYRLADDVAGQS